MAVSCGVGPWTSLARRRRPWSETTAASARTAASASPTPSSLAAAARRRRNKQRTTGRQLAASAILQCRWQVVNRRSRLTTAAANLVASTAVSAPSAPRKKGNARKSSGMRTDSSLKTCLAGRWTTVKQQERLDGVFYAKYRVAEKHLLRVFRWIRDFYGKYRVAEKHLLCVFRWIRNFYMKYRVAEKHVLLVFR